MNKLILIVSLILCGKFANAQQDIYHHFKNSDAIYVPDENKTYFVEKIIESTDSEGNDQIRLVGVKANMSGNHIPALVNTDPSLRPIIKSDKHRKDVNPLPNVNKITCVNGGLLCVILLKKNQFDGE